MPQGERGRDSIVRTATSSAAESTAAAAVTGTGRGPGRGLRVDTSIITGKGGSKAIQEEDRARKEAARRRIQERVLDQQDRLIQQGGIGRMDGSNRGLGIYRHDDDGDGDNDGIANGDDRGRIVRHDELRHELDDEEGVDMHGDDGEMMMEEDDEEDGEMHRGHQHVRDRGDEGDENDNEEGELMDDEMEDDDLSSSPSIPDEHIDFDLVYALHTFLATVEGQASVVKGDSLTLLDDSNSYWWLVRVLKTQAVGYIPAENIETPFERLARLNKHRNVDLTTVTSDDLMNGTGSSLAQTRFAQPHHPTNKSLKQSNSRPPVQLNPQLAGGGRFVDFAPPIYHPHEGYAYSDSNDESAEYGEDGMEYDDAQDGEHGEDDDSEGSFEGGSAEDIRAHNAQQAAFDDDEDEGGNYQIDEGEEADNEDATVTLQPHDAERGVLQPISASSAAANTTRNAQAQQQAALGVGRPAHIQAAYGGVAEDTSPPSQLQQLPAGQQQLAGPPQLNRKMSIDEQLRMQQEASQRVSAPMHPGQASTSSSISGRPPPGSRTGSAASAQSRLKPFVDETGQLTSPASGESSETRKISLTPRIARDDSQESNLSDRALSPTPSNNSVQRQPFRNISNASSSISHGAGDNSIVSAQTAGSQATSGQGDYVHYRRGSAGSAATASSFTSSGSGHTKAKEEKRSTSPATNAGADQPKKKKSTGILGGLFGRGKKDKEKEKEKEKDKKDKDSKKTESSGPRRKSSTSTLSDDERASNAASPAPRSPDKHLSQLADAGTQQSSARRNRDPAKEGMFGTDAALRQQQVEAQKAMYQNYGIHPRNPSDITNTSTFSANRSPDGPQSGNMTLSPSSASTGSGLSASVGGKPRRPGSLIGSPHMAVAGMNGGEAPNLNVLRVFAGENIVSESTFKTVLLNEGTTTENLVKQAMQRFRLPPPSESAALDDKTGATALLSDYYLTAKEVSGDETVLEAGQIPLKIFESLSQASGAFNMGQMMPSVKRSSVGSISSIASNLTYNPAIEKLRMSDFSDDSVVKLFINKRTPVPGSAQSEKGESEGRQSEDSFQVDPSRLSATGSIIDKGPAPGMPSSPLLRFAVRIIIHSQDLPESMVFDPASPAIIPKSALMDRRSSNSSTLANPGLYREKIVFFPRNANVSEVLETGLDRFGILEGVVDGGDAVEDKLSKRRSISRIRYSMTVRFDESGGKETLLAPSTKIIDAYHAPPVYKHYERNSKEFRRRSMDAPYNTPSMADLQSSDPVFIIRKAFNKHHGHKGSSESGAEKSLLRPAPQPLGTAANSAMSSRSVYTTPSSELPPDLERTISPSCEAATTSLQASSLPGAIGQMDSSASLQMRGPTNLEGDTKEIVQHEWQENNMQQVEDGSSTPVPSRDTASVLSHATSDSFASALSSPMTPLAPSSSSRNLAGAFSAEESDAEESSAIDRLVSAPMDIDQSRGPLDDGFNRQTPFPNPAGREAGQAQIDTAGSQAQAGNVAGGVASALRNQSLQHARQSPAPRSANTSIDSGRSTPATITRSGSIASRDLYPNDISRVRSGSTGSAATSGRGSPAPQVVTSRSTPQPNAPPSSQSSTPKQQRSRGHTKQFSNASVSSETSSASPNTATSASAGHTTSTPISSTRNESSLAGSLGRAPVPYREDHSLEFLLNMVEMDAGHVKIPRPRKADALGILSDVPHPHLSDEGLVQTYGRSRQKVDALDSQLDQLLEQVLAGSA